MPKDRFKNARIEKVLRRGEHFKNLRRWRRRNKHKPWFKEPRERSARAWLREVLRRPKVDIMVQGPRDG